MDEKGGLDKLQGEAGNENWKAINFKSGCIKHKPMKARQTRVALLHVKSIQKWKVIWAIVAQ